MQRVKKHIDYFTVILYLLLVTVGWIAIYIADIHVDMIGGRHQNQQLWIGISSLVALFIIILNKQLIVDLAYHYYITLMIILLVILFVGKEINGAKAWIQIGGFQIQPAEFAKFATSLALAKYIGSPDFSFRKFSNIILAFGIIFIPLSLIILQNDMGSALVFCSFSIAMYREGLSSKPFLLAIFALFIVIATIKWGVLPVITSLFFLSLFLSFFLVRKNIKQFLSLLLLPLLVYISAKGFLQLEEMSVIIYSLCSYVLLLLVYLFIYSGSIITKETIRGISFIILLISSFSLSLSVSYLFNTLLQAHQKERILQVIGEAPESYNIMHSKIAIALGGLTGQGFLNGTHTKLAYVPEQETDFIFTTLGETYGFLGSSFVILLFVTFILRLIHLAERQTARFSRVYGYAIVGIFIFHFTINVGMVLGLLPVIGIPLPFFSYGGSSLLAFTILLFIMLKLDISREDRVI